MSGQPSRKFSDSSDNGTVSGFVGSFYESKGQRSRITKELENLEKLQQEQRIHYDVYKLETGLKIMVGLTHGFFDQITKSKVLTNILLSKNIKFVFLEILLDEKFPFSSPLIFFLSQLGISLEFNDGRDLFEAIMKRKWSSLVLINSIINEIPSFLNEVFRCQNQIERLYSMGKYHHQRVYLITMLASESNFMFNIYKIHKTIGGRDVLKKEILCGTPTAILRLTESNFENPDQNQLVIKQIHDIRTLALVKKKNFKEKGKQAINQAICLFWRKPNPTAYKDEILDQEIIVCSNSDALLESLQLLLLKAGLRVESNLQEQIQRVISGGNNPSMVKKQNYIEHPKTQRIEPLIQEDKPVTPFVNEYVKDVADKSQNLEYILLRISELESLLDMNGLLSYEEIQELMKLYGDCVEIYSTEENSIFNLFLSKSQGLMARDDVKMVMESMTEAKNHKSSGDQQKIQTQQQKDEFDDSLGFDSYPYLLDNQDGLGSDQVFKFKSSESEEEEQEEQEENDDANKFVIDHDDELFLGDDTPLPYSGQKENQLADFLALDIQEEKKPPNPIVNNFLLAEGNSLEIEDQESQQHIIKQSDIKEKHSDVEEEKSPEEFEQIHDPLESTNHQESRFRTPEAIKSTIDESQFETEEFNQPQLLQKPSFSGFKENNSIEIKHMPPVLDTSLLLRKNIQTSDEEEQYTISQIIKMLST